MDKKNWDDFVKEPMSEGLKAKTLARARQELEGLNQSHRFSLAWLIPMIPALGVLLFFVGRKEDGQRQDLEIASEMEYMDELTDMTAQELADFDPDTIHDLDFLEDLEFLEGWDGTESES